MSKKIIVCLLLLWLAAVLQPAAAQEDVTLELTTTPAAAAILPDVDLVQTTLTVRSAAGEPIRNSRLQLRLENPPRSLLFSTDFPIVEGTTLLEVDTLAPDGSFTFYTIYPIRGSYTAHARAILPDGRTLNQTFTLTLNENPAEIRSLAILLGLLLAFGLVSGLIIGRSARARAAALIPLALLVAPLAARAHGDGEGVINHSALAAHDAPPLSDSTTADGRTLTFTLTPGAGTVGRLNTFTLTLQGADGQPLPDTSFNLELWHAEDGKPLFTCRLFAPEGTADFAFQFFDGADHELRLAATTAGGDRLTLDHVIGVQGISPPLWIKAKTIAFFLLFTALFMLVGLWLAGGRLR